MSERPHWLRIFGSNLEKRIPREVSYEPIDNRRWQSTTPNGDLSLQVSGVMALVCVGTGIGAVVAYASGNNELGQTLTVASAASGSISFLSFAQGISSST